MQIQYLEIVTGKVDETCAALASLTAASFSAPNPLFGNVRIADPSGGGRMCVRALMRPDEAPVVRPYMRVDSIEKAAVAIEAAGGCPAKVNSPSTCLAEDSTASGRFEGVVIL